MRIHIYILLLSITSSLFAMEIAPKRQKRDDIEYIDYSKALPTEVWMVILYMGEGDRCFKIKNVISLSKYFYDMVKNGDYKGRFYAPWVTSIKCNNLSKCHGLRLKFVPYLCPFEWTTPRGGKQKVPGIVLPAINDTYVCNPDGTPRYMKNEYNRTNKIFIEYLQRMFKEINIKSSLANVRRLHITTGHDIKFINMNDEFYSDIRLDNVESLSYSGDKSIMYFIMPMISPEKITILRIPTIDDWNTLRGFTNLKELVIDGGWKSVSSESFDRNGYLPNLEYLKIRYSSNLKNIFDLEKIPVLFLKFEHMVLFEGQKKKLKVKDEFKRMKGLTGLDLAGFGLYTLPDLDGLKNLHELDVSKNHIKKIDFSKLKRLKYINVSGNENLMLNKKQAKYVLARYRDGMIVEGQLFIDFGNDIDAELEFYHKNNEPAKVIRRYEAWAPNDANKKELKKKTEKIVESSYKALSE